MTLAPQAKTKLVSARELSRTVEAAVKAASARVAGAEAASPVILRWELVGRRARTLAQGEELAVAITEELGKSKFQAEPAVLGLGKYIICGFFEPPNVPLERAF